MDRQRNGVESLLAPHGERSVDWPDVSQQPAVMAFRERYTCVGCIGGGKGSAAINLYDSKRNPAGQAGSDRFGGRADQEIPSIRGLPPANLDPLDSRCDQGSIGLMDRDGFHRHTRRLISRKAARAMVRRPRQTRSALSAESCALQMYRTTRRRICSQVITNSPKVARPCSVADRHSSEECLPGRARAVTADAWCISMSHIYQLCALSSIGGNKSRTRNEYGS